MDDRDQELLDKQLRHVGVVPRNDAPIALMLVVVFFAGITFGGYLFAHKGAPTILASSDAMQPISPPGVTPTIAR